ncbi:hypothetical protein AAG570_004231 [Ranatra chinensis]|uniref:Ion transport domain-containing protein n=1 Tax=Ranatra chinensis TaxID=642074 RepID=A0ABD0YFR6_9HEMI
MRLNGLNDRLEYKATKNEMERNKKIHMYTGYEYASYLNSLATKNILRSLSGLKEGPLVKRIERIKCFDQFFIDAEYGSKYFAQVVVTESYSDDPILLKFDPPWHIKVDNDLVHTWNLIVVLATLVNAIVLTYYLVFSQTYPQGLHYFSLFIWLLNLVDTFFTVCLGIRREPYEDIEYGVVHVILEGSCRKEWWLELVSILPFSIIYQGLAGGGVPTTSTLMHFNLLMKFYKVKFVVKKYLDLNVSVMTGLLTKSALLFAMYFYWTVAVNHMLTCYPYPCSKKTWVTEPTPRDQSTLSDHLSSSDLKEAVAELLHYNAMLVLGHSSGHFKGPHPVSKFDLLLALAVEILTTALILLFMAYLVATTINANSSRYDLMDLVTSWESWCRCLRVDAGLVARSRGYTRRLWSSPRSLAHLKYTTLFRHLGTSHIAKLARTRFFPSLMQCPFFKDGDQTKQVQTNELSAMDD